MTSIVTEEDALRILNDPNSKITLDDAHTMVSVLQKSIIDRDDALERKIIGEHSFYEGEYNILRMTEKILQKLNLNNREEN